MKYELDVWRHLLDVYRENLKQSKMHKDSRPRPDFFKSGIYVAKYKEGYLCTKFERCIFICEVLVLQKMSLIYF